MDVSDQEGISPYSSPTFAIAVVVYNQVKFTRNFFDMMFENTYGAPQEFLVWDNGSNDATVDYLKGMIGGGFLGGDFKVFSSEKNLGIIKPLDRLWRVTDAEWIGYLHNDISAIEYQWDIQLRDTINSHKGEKLGIVGFEGSGGVGPIGERVGFMSNLPNAEAHGSRIKEPYRFGAIMDGCAMFINRMLLEEMGGWDKGYFVHHIYDYDICIESLSRGYKNIILNIEFDHRSGMTATQMDFRTIEGKGEEWYMAHNTRRFQEKWVNPLNWDENLHPGTDISLEYQKYIERGKVYLPLVVNPWDGEVKWGYEK